MRGNIDRIKESIECISFIRFIQESLYLVNIETIAFPRNEFLNTINKFNVNNSK